MVALSSQLLHSLLKLADNFLQLSHFCTLSGLRWRLVNLILTWGLLDRCTSVPVPFLELLDALVVVGLGLLELVLQFVHFFGLVRVG